MQIDAKTVAGLRRKTGAGMMDCKRALQEAEGDLEKAEDILRAKGAKSAAKRAGRATKEGVIGTYMHHDNKRASMIELLCETDFVARNEEFRELASNMAMHVIAASPEPQYLKPEDIPEDVIERERRVYAEQVADKPEQIREKIIDGKMAAFYKDHCLLDQPYAMDTEVGSVRDALQAATAKLGENIQVGRFAKLVLGSE